MNIVGLVINQAAQRPDHPAIIEGEHSLTYAELATLTRRTAAHLRTHGIQSGDRVGLALQDNTDHLVALLAIAWVGAAIVPIDWRAPPEEKQRLANAFDVALVLTAARAKPVSNVASVAVDEAWRADVAAAAPDRDMATDSTLPFVLNLSSGTSGAPKAALVTHTDYRFRLARYSSVYGRIVDQRYLSVMPLCFSAGRNIILHHLTSGSTVILYPPLFGPEEYLEAAGRYRATFAFVVPTILRALLEVPAHDGPLLPDLQYLASGSAFLYPEEKLAISKHINRNFYQSYSTSGTGNISVLHPGELATHAASVGIPNLLTTVEIVDDHGSVVAPGETGRLRCQGPGISTRYYGTEALASGDEGIRDGWFYTGELATADAAGYLYLRGRVSNLIVRGGANVYPEEVERVLLAHPAVTEVAVIGRAANGLGEEVVAAIVPHFRVSARELSNFCRDKLAPYKIPAEIVFVEALPRTTSGKVKRADVLRHIATARSPEERSLAPA